MYSCVFNIYIFTTYLYTNVLFIQYVYGKAMTLCGNGNYVDRKSHATLWFHLYRHPFVSTNPHLTQPTPIYWSFNYFPFSSLSSRQWFAIIIYNLCVFVTASKFPWGFSWSNSYLVLAHKSSLLYLYIVKI